MANSVFIHEATYPVLTESQVYEWRKESYANLGNTFEYSHDEVTKLPYYKLPKMEELLDEMSNTIKEAKILGKLTYSTDTFMYIDSSSMCQMTIVELITKMYIKYPHLKQTNIICIFSQISKIENLYKFVKNYNGVDYRILKFNLDLINNIIPFKIDNMIILNTNLMFDNKFLISEEISHLKTFSKWGKANTKNEINDNAQIGMMIQILNYFNISNGLVISHDKKFCQKIKYLMTKFDTLYILDKDDL